MMAIQTQEMGEMPFEQQKQTGPEHLEIHQHRALEQKYEEMEKFMCQQQAIEMMETQWIMTVAVQLELLKQDILVHQETHLLQVLDQMIEEMEKLSTQQLGIVMMVIQQMEMDVVQAVLQKLIGHELLAIVLRQVYEVIYVEMGK